MNEKDRLIAKLLDGSAREAGPDTEYFGMRITAVLKQQLRYLAELNDVNLSKMGSFLLNIGVGQYIHELREDVRIQADLENQSPEVQADYAHKAAEAEKYERFLEEFPEEDEEGEVPF